MRLTAYTDYSLRVLIYLALHPDRRPTIAEIAGRYGVSKAHLMKVVYQLGLMGYVETVRGKGGGLTLAKRLDDVTVSWWNGLLAGGASAAATAETVMVVLFLRVALVPADGQRAKSGILSAG